MRFRLNTTFQEKNLAKAQGARWDGELRTWYYEGDTLPEGLQRWYDGPPEGDVPVHAAGDVPQAAGDMPWTIPDSGRISEEDAGSYKKISEISRIISDTYQAQRELNSIHVQGEVTNYRDDEDTRRMEEAGMEEPPHHTGHYFFDIKQEVGGRVLLLHCKMWQETAYTGLVFRLRRGQKVAIDGSLEYYPGSGATQVNASRIRLIGAGAGAARQALLLLERRLAAEGLFDLSHKKSIPEHPARVGILTSPSGEAIKDIKRQHAERNPYIPYALYPVTVQGVNAVRSMVRGIQVMDGMGFDVLIIGRGGGSTEELNVYNDEAVVRAIYAANTPIIAAIGHGGHVSLVDQVADDTVATPTQAAVKVFPDVKAEEKRLEEQRLRLQQQIRGSLDRRIAKTELMLAKLEAGSPRKKLENKKDRLELLTTKMHGLLLAGFRERMHRMEQAQGQLTQGILQAVEARKHRFGIALARLDGLSPTAKLIGGFGYITTGQEPVRSATQVKEKDPLEITLHDGQIRAVVMETMVKGDGNGQEE